MKPTTKPLIFNQKLLIALLIAVSLIAGFFFIKFNNSEKETHDKIVFNKDKNPENHLLTEFDPNELSAKQWQQLGFSEKQATTILKYKRIVGGFFTSKEQFKKCYAVSDEKYSELEKYILLPEKETESFFIKHGNSKSSYPKKNNISVHHKFNPDEYTVSDWEKLGFSEKQSAAILKYKSFLGGSFISKEKFRECFVINEENYQKLEPFILLPETATLAKNEKFVPQKNEKTKPVYENFDPNILNLEGWKKLGFSEKQAVVILNYKNRNLKGSFQNLEEIKSCFVISEEKFNEISPFIQLNPENFVKRNTVAEVKSQNPEVKTNFSSIDLNQITHEQLLEFGFEKKAASSFIGFRNKLGGFVNKNQIFESFDIDRDLAEKLNKTVLLNNKNVAKYSLMDAPESWLKTHPYFRYSADKIIYYRLSNSNEEKIWKMMNIKPEYVAKMKLYLK